MTTEPKTRKRGYTSFVKKLVLGDSSTLFELFPGEDRHYIRRKLMATAAYHKIKIKAPFFRKDGIDYLFVVRTQ